MGGNGIFTTELVVLGGLASGLGVLIGYGLQIVLVDTIAGLLTISLPEPTAKPAILGFLTGFITLFGFDTSIDFTGQSSANPCIEA